MKAPIIIFIWSLFTMVAHTFGMEEAVYEASIERTEVNPSYTNVLDLGGYLRWIARHNTTPESNPIFEKIRSTLLAAPGHAQHFARKIEESRSKGTLSRDSYWYLNETLVHLPSPETVKVLGHYLNDERDKPPSPPRHPGTIPYPGTFMRAFEALSEIGLRDLPVFDLRVEAVKPDPDLKWTDEQIPESLRRAIVEGHLKQQEALAAYRSWWEEVKSGQRSFSFKGQSVEYRFKPDGTWDTFAIANPPDDGPKPLAAVLPSGWELRPGPADSTSGQTMTRPWILIAIICGLALVIWFGLRKSKRSTN